MRRNYSLSSVGSVEYTTGRNPRSSAAVFKRERSYFNADSFNSLPVATITAWVSFPRTDNQQGILSFVNRRGEGINIVVLKQGQPAIELTTRKRRAHISFDEGIRYKRLRRKRADGTRRRGFFGSVARISSDVALDTSWHHIAAVRERDVVSRNYVWLLYLNGKEIARGMTDFEPDFSHAKPDLVIGAARRSKRRPARFATDGMIDDLTLWQRPLSKSEIQLLSQKN